MNNREQITIAPETRATIVYAKATKSSFQDWLLLIDRVTEEKLYPYTEKDKDLMIYTHVSWNVTQGMATSNVGENCNWGYVYHYGYKFYKPNEEDVKKIKEILKLYDKRYVKGINKMFDR
jgi:hypothetical protein